MRNKVQPTPEQVEALQHLKNRLAEIGYMALPVSDAYRRHATDFVVLSKTGVNDFAIVRIARKFIVLYPFGVKSNTIIRLLKSMRSKKHVPMMYLGPKLPGPVPDQRWRPFVHESAHKEVEQLIYGK